VLRTFYAIKKNQCRVHKPELSCLMACDRTRDKEETKQKYSIKQL